MEVPGMDKVKRVEDCIASATGFVQQDELDDACSICLEAFSHSDPSTATICQHDFHLQCILEWCQRSSNCPMCWQPICLKDDDSQELLVAVEQERRLMSSRSRNAAMYHHPTIGGFDLQHLPGVENDPGLPDQIVQQLIAAAAIWRSDDIAGGQSSTTRPSSNTSQQFMVSSADPNAISSGGQTDMNSSPPLVDSYNRSNSASIDRTGPSDSWRSRLSSISLKYKESISENTRVWKEKLFSRSSSSMADIVSEVRTEINSGMASVSRMMQRLETRDNSMDTRYERPSNGSHT